MAMESQLIHFDVHAGRHISIAEFQTCRRKSSKEPSMNQNSKLVHSNADQSKDWTFESDPSNLQPIGTVNADEPLNLSLESATPGSNDSRLLTYLQKF